MSARGEFSSRLGFIMAAAGSAIGLGNIWGFPTQVASNGGAAFVLVYIVLTFLLAYPVLMTELIIGRYANSNTVDALRKISPNNKPGMLAASFTGFWGLLTASLILSFYAIVAGWMVAFFLQSLVDMFGIGASLQSAVAAVGLGDSANWLTEFSLERNLLFCTLFMLLTIKIISGGVADGIERWSTRLMPLLLLIIVALIIYIATLPGAAEGWKVYWLPDFSRIFSPDLILSAMGQAFFSLSLGVGTMMVYGSYVSKKENLPTLGASVALVDIGVAILAGLLIIPAMYVALHNGVEIFSEGGQLIDGSGLIFTVLPALFSSMEFAGKFVAIAFFALMSIAALTSSISMLEVPVAYTVEKYKMARSKASWLIGGLIFLFSTTIIYNFEKLFELVIAIATQYSEPMVGFLFCIFAGWIWKRNQILTELQKGAPEVANTLFWKIWPVYVRWVCPVVILAVFWHSL